jgi:DNA-binding transcriptional MerR regulator
MLIGELAETCDTTVRALRYYEQQGLLHAGRAANGYRMYDERAVQRVGNIRLLLSLGFTAEDVRGFLPCLDRDIAKERRCPGKVTFIADKLADLEGKIRELSDVRDRLAEFLGQVGGPASASPDRPGREP